MSETGTAAVVAKDFQTRVKDHVINTLGSIIPEEQFGQMVEAAMKEFFETPKQYSFEKDNSEGYRYREAYKLQTLITPFQFMVWEIVKPIVQNRLSTYMNKEDGSHPIDKYLKDIFENPEFDQQQVLKAQQLMIAMVSSMFFQIGDQAKMEMRNTIAQAAFNAEMPHLGNAILNADDFHLNPRLNPR